MAGRTVGRTIGASIGGVQEPLSAEPHTPKSSNLLSLPSNPTSSTALFASSSSSSSFSFSSSSCFCDCDACGLKYIVDGGNRESKRGLCRKCVFGSVPSKGEVEDALSALLQAVVPSSCSEFTENGSDPSSGNAVTDQIASPGSMHQLTSGGSEIESIEPAPPLHNPGILQSYGGKKVTAAFHLLHSEPSIQRMVVSLSTDKAVWDAVLNNQVVQEVRDKLCLAEKERADSSQKGPGTAKCGAATCITTWVLHNTKGLIVELIEKIIKLMIKGFQPAEGGTTSPPIHHLEDALRSSLLLTVVILLMVIVSRANGV